MMTGTRARALVLTACGALVLSACHPLHSWGEDGYGQLGDGQPGGSSATAVQELTDGEWSKVAAGPDHTCAILRDGTLWCWGHNDQGQLGDGTTVDRAEPTQVGTEGGWTAVAAAEDPEYADPSTSTSHTCGIRDGTLWCWGADDSGQLGQGAPSTSPALLPRRVGTAGDWQGIGLGTRHSCGIRNGGALWCWGANGAGQLGVGDQVDRATPTLVPGTWTQVDGGEAHSCGLRTDRRVHCWGATSQSRIGTSTGATYQTTPVPIDDGNLNPPDAPWTSLSVGSMHACAIRLEGLPVHPQRALYCWGRNRSGRLGILYDPHWTAWSGPVRAGGWSLLDPRPPDGWALELRTVEYAQVSAGSDFTCARRVSVTRTLESSPPGPWDGSTTAPDERVECWGANGTDQLGEAAAGLPSLVPSADGEALWPTCDGEVTAAALPDCSGPHLTHRPVAVAAGGAHTVVLVDG